MPNGIEFIDEIPHTATGKIKKMVLKEMYRNYIFEDDK